VVEPDRFKPLLVPVMLMFTVFWPWAAVRVSVQVVDAPGANVAAAHVTVAPGAVPASPLIGAPPVFDTATTIDTVLPVVTVGPGADPAG